MLEEEVRASLVRGVKVWTGRTVRDFMLAYFSAAASLVSCEVRSDRWVQPHCAVRATFASGRWSHTVSQFVKHTSVWLACWLPCIGKGRESESAEVGGAWEIFEDVLRFMSAREVKVLWDAVRCRDNCAAGEAWSSAAEVLQSILAVPHLCGFCSGVGSDSFLEGSSWWFQGPEDLAQ